MDGIKQTGLVEELEETEHLYASETHKSGLIETFGKLYKRNTCLDKNHQKERIKIYKSRGVGLFLYFSENIVFPKNYTKTL